MPLKLVPPRKGKSPNWTIRGTHLKVHVDKTSGTDRRSLARSIRDELERKIERGEYPPKEAEAGTREVVTFADAALAYLEAGRRRRYVARLIKHFAETPAMQIDQAAIDAAAIAICPDTTPANRNTAVYTPVSAILRHAGVKLALKRPKGAKGRIITDWLTPEAASAIIRAAEAFDPELALLLLVLLYTGLRLSEALRLRWEDIVIKRRAAWVRRSKGGPAGAIVLRGEVCAALRAHRPRSSGRLFRFHQGGHLKHLLTRAKLSALGVSCPIRRPLGWRAPPYEWPWVNFHTFRHTWATWMRKAGTDTLGLVATGNWRDPRSAARYTHAIAHEEWRRVERLPKVKRS
jgi:integrase